MTQTLLSANPAWDKMTPITNAWSWNMLIKTKTCPNTTPMLGQCSLTPNHPKWWQITQRSHCKRNTNWCAIAEYASSKGAQIYTHCASQSSPRQANQWQITEYARKAWYKQCAQLSWRTADWLQILEGACRCNYKGYYREMQNDWICQAKSMQTLPKYDASNNMKMRVSFLCAGAPGTVFWVRTTPERWKTKRM